MTYPFGKLKYFRPKILAEALEFLSRHGSKAGVMAGGTDLIPRIRQNLTAPVWMLDVKKIDELNRLEWRDEEGLHLGAAVSLARLLAFQPLSERFGLLAQACSLIGSMQIKNRGTVGGNICNAAPSADSAPALLCLKAKALVASLKGRRKIDLRDFFLAPGKTALLDDELLLEIEIPPPPPLSAGCYLRHTTRSEMDIAMVGVASFLVLSPVGGKVMEARIALGAVAPTPKRAFAAESELSGQPITRRSIEAGAEKAAAESNPISDVRASAEYRRDMIKVLTRRTLMDCVRRLQIDLLP